MRNLARILLIIALTLPLGACWQANYALFYVKDSAMPDVAGVWLLEKKSYSASGLRMPETFRLSPARQGGFTMVSLETGKKAPGDEVVFIPLSGVSAYLLGTRTSKGNSGEHWVYNLLRVEGNDAWMVEGRCSKSAVIAGISGDGTSCSAAHGTPLLAAAYDQLSKPNAWASALHMQRISR